MAGEELAKVRSKFVEKVSKEVIKQILDELLEDGVLNEGESESIIEENSSRADKARCLIDKVKKKGDVASTKMIVHLKSKDPTLYTTLGLSHEEPVQQAAEPLQKPSTLATTSQDNIEHKKLHGNSIYHVSKESMLSRVALLICNKDFTNKKLNRKGAEKDVVNMEHLLSTLGYEVVKHTNLTGKGIDSALMSFSQHSKLAHTDSVFVVIMSHGKLGAVFGVDYAEEKPDEFPINNIYKYLGPGNCPALLNKPKIIVIQACRGAEAGAVLVSDCVQPDVVSDDVSPPEEDQSAAEEGIEDDALHWEHKEKDFISLLSSTPDTVSYRQTDRGSFLIQYTMEVFNSSSRDDDIEELFRKVMQRFEDFSVHNKRQMPTKDRCTLTKRFYLFPGH
ncbi:caspase-1-A-like isoform X1 [Sphaeramia orbicularis]|uniref:caspase-1-A-like isoform X1 n=1 Tax=Sphaeramia orbicularis TaxID=375764 RepID=UPI00117C8B18|nr:caspase-1-A-like isoform X1 [Sphaeramia orbicularis]